MEGGYYVRARGKISGPFDVLGLQKLIRRNALSRMHEVSSDRQEWAPAGQFEELFPASAARTVGIAGRRPSPAVATAEVEEIEIAPAVSPPRAELSYYYAQNGVAVGPVPIIVLQSLARNGTLQPRDLVWQEGNDVGTEAGHLSVLASFYSAAHYPASAVRMPESQVHPELLRRSAVAAGSIAKGWGLVVGIMLVIFLNLPIASINGKLLWCWSAVGVAGTGLLVTYCAFFLFIGIILCIVSPLVPAAGRGIVFIGASGVMAVLLGVSALMSHAPGSMAVGVIGLYLTPMFCAMLLGASRARRLNPPNRGARTSQCVFASLTGLCGLVMGVTMIVESRGVSLLPDSVAAAYVLLMLAFAAALAAGMLGMIAAARTFSSGLNLASMITGAGCSVLIALALLLVYVGLADTVNIGNDFYPAFEGSRVRPVPSAGVFFLLLARMVAMFAGLAALAGVGLFDILMAPWAPPRPARQTYVDNAAAANALQHLQ